MKDTKQVIVMRTDLNMRKGKMVAQGAHASLASLTNLVNDGTLNNVTNVYKEWLNDSFKKICVGVDSEEELREVMKKAIEAGIQVSAIFDNGDTEFNGVKTFTCIAIGPDYSEKIDPVTGDLRLL